MCRSWTHGGPAVLIKDQQRTQPARRQLQGVLPTTGLDPLPRMEKIAPPRSCRQRRPIREAMQYTPASRMLPSI